MKNNQDGRVVPWDKEQGKIYNYIQEEIVPRG